MRRAVILLSLPHPALRSLPTSILQSFKEPFPSVEQIEFHFRAATLLYRVDMPRSSPSLLLLCFFAAAHAFVPFPSPPQPLPRFAPSYDMFDSSIIMPCNYTGQFEVDVSTQWGIADLDWSNGKKQWIQNHPMTSQEELVQAATNIHQASSGSAKSTSVWVYR